MLKAVVPEIHVRSSLAARDFCSMKLGFECVSSWRPDNSTKDPCYMGFVRDGVRLNVTSFRDGVFGASVYVYVEDVDALHAEFTERGVPELGAINDQTWGTREFGVTDPDQNKIRFGQHLPSTHLG